jgi:hypothetical protein
MRFTASPIDGSSAPVLVRTRLDPGFECRPDRCSADKLDLRTCNNRLDTLLAGDKTQRPQFVAVQINFYDRQY